MLSRLVMIFAALSILFSPISVRAGTDNSDWAGAALGLEGASAEPAISANDLLKLRDISGLRSSPDGKYLAFSVREMDLKTNRYKVRWFIADTHEKQPPRMIQMDGGQPIPAMHLGVPQAWILEELPFWSPDSRHIAMRRLDGTKIELWVADAETGKASKIDDGASQVTAIGWRSAQEIVYRTNLNMSDFERGVEEESRNGWVWDSRVAHATSRLRPMVPDCTLEPGNRYCTPRIWVVDLGTGGRREIQAPAEGLGNPTGAEDVARRSDGAVAQFVIADPRHANAAMPVRRVSATASGTSACSALECVSARWKSIGWTADGRKVWIVKQLSDQRRPDGVPGDQSGLFTWDVSTGKLKQIYLVDGILSGCQKANVNIFCVEERSTQPGEIVAINLENGRRHTFADANPTFKSKIFPRIGRLIRKRCFQATGIQGMSSPIALAG